MTKFSLLITSFSFLLTACGGGGSDSGSGSNPSQGGGNSGSEITYVAGEVKYSADHEDNITAPKAGGGNASDGTNCADSTYYFESENVAVFGGEGYPETDMKYAATLVENNLDTAFSKMGITKEEFDLARPYYIPGIANKIIDLMADGWSDVDGNNYDITSLTLDYPFNSDGWLEAGSVERFALVHAYWNSLDKAGQYLLGREFDKVSYYKIPELNFGAGDYRTPFKIMVCLSDRQNASLYGQGTLFGMVLARHSVHKRQYNDESQVVLHELIHTIQANISAPVKYSSLDHWFKEGQATFLAGQNTAKSKDGKRPVDVTRWADEGKVFSSTGDAYKHYALAYSLIADDKEAIKGLLYDVRYYKGYSSEIQLSIGVSGKEFESAFDNNMNVTLSDFRANY